MSPLWVIICLYAITPQILAGSNVRCDFENDDWCGITQDNSDDFDWLIHSGSSSPYTGPKMAYSGKKCVSISSSSRKSGEKAVIKLPSVGSDGEYCLAFAYSMNGRKGCMSKLEVMWNADELLWSRSEPQGDSWQQGFLRYPLQSGDQLAFQATIQGGGRYGDVALDDISFKLCDSSDKKIENAIKAAQRSKERGDFVCDFDGGGICDMRQSDDSFNWQLRRAGQSVVRSRHPGRFYLAFDADNSRGRIKKGARAQISLPRVKHAARYCLTFWYKMSGKAGTQSQLGVWQDRVSSGYRPGTQLWSNAEPTVNQWMQYQLKADLVQNGKISFEGILNSADSLGDLALDDITLKKCGKYAGTTTTEKITTTTTMATTRKPSGKPSKHYLKCDFEDGTWCGMTHTGDWRIETKGYTGPVQPDKWAGGKKFALLTSGSGEIVLPPAPPGSSYCYGPWMNVNRASLKMYLNDKLVSQTTATNSKWQGDLHYGLKKLQSEGVLKFVAQVPGGDSTAYVALDYIIMSNGNCY